MTVVPSHFVLTDDGVRLWATSQGRGLPLVLCHGGPGMWDNLTDLAARRRHGDGDSLVDALPEVELHVLSDVGHLPWVEAPDVTREIVTDFLRRTAVVGS